MIDQTEVATAIAEVYLTQPKDMAWEDRTDQLAAAVMQFFAAAPSAGRWRENGEAPYSLQLVMGTNGIRLWTFAPRRSWPGDQPPVTYVRQDVLRTAVRHIEHMAAWISRQRKGYSFEDLGEDIDTLRVLAKGDMLAGGAWKCSRCWCSEFATIDGTGDRRCVNCKDVQPSSREIEARPSIYANRTPAEALDAIHNGATVAVRMFEDRVKERKGRLTWWAVNVLQDAMAAIAGTAERAK